MQDSVSIVVTIQKFQKRKHRIKYVPDPHHLCSVRMVEGMDSLREVFGIDGDVPKREYRSILFIVNKDTTRLPIANVFNPNIEGHAAFYSASDNTWYLEAYNSDGSAYYNVTWSIDAHKIVKEAAYLDLLD